MGTILLFISIFLYFLSIPYNIALAEESLVKHLKGRIVLRVQNKGEAWYINPDDGKRYFLGRPADAFRLMKSLGLGITDEDLFNIPLAQGEWDEGGTWAKYENSFYNFSLKYPENALVFCVSNFCKNDGADKDVHQIYIQGGWDGSKYAAYDVQIEIYKNRMTRSAIQFGKEMADYNAALSSSVKNAFETVFALQTAYQYDITGSLHENGYLISEGMIDGDGSSGQKLEQEFRAIYFDKGGHIYKIYYSKNSKVSQEIIESFKFK